MPNSIIYQQSDFPAALKWQAIAFIKTEWPFVFTGDDLFLTEPSSPDLDPVHFVVSEADSLISYASVFRLNLDHSGTSYKIYGFGNLFTFPPYRRKGYGRQILELATGFIKHSDVDAAILFCEPQVEMFYTACGWKPAPAPTRIGIPSDYEVHEGVGKMILYVSEKGQQGKPDFENQPLYVEWPW